MFLGLRGQYKDFSVTFDFSSVALPECCEYSVVMQGTTQTYICYLNYTEHKGEQKEVNVSIDWLDKFDKQYKKFRKVQG